MSKEAKVAFLAATALLAVKGKDMEAFFAADSPVEPEIAGEIASLSTAFKNAGKVGDEERATNIVAKRNAALTDIEEGCRDSSRWVYYPSGSVYVDTVVTCAGRVGPDEWRLNGNDPDDAEFNAVYLDDRAY